ncbi:MAG: hypothetical protein MJ180_02695 [Candidatus Gastranaerophilales bacterium]|nr:hypothetical protein [Candidatus Gastranaerophilales bacterium]
MYFIEKIMRIFYPKKKFKTIYNQQNIDECEHIFLPVDSSKVYLACTKCGKVIKNPE